MRSKDSKQLLENARFKHLDESTLTAYKDGQLDEIDNLLAEGHLRLCLICEQKLTFLKEAEEALNSYVLTEKDKTSIDEFLKRQENKLSKQITAELKRLKAHFEDLKFAWKLPFRRLAMRGASRSDEIWKYESEDGLLTGRAVQNRSGSLTVHFSSHELAWKNFRIRFGLGSFSKEVTLQAKGDKVSARVLIPARELPKKMSDISIEVLSSQD